MGIAHDVTKRINLYQLSQELGNPPLQMDGTGDGDEPKTIRAKGVGDENLAAALEAHVADFAIVPPPSPTDVANGQLLQSIFADLASLGLTVNSLGDLNGRIGDFLPAARAQRAAATSTAQRLAVLEAQCETLAKLVVAGLFRRVI